MATVMAAAAPLVLAGERGLFHLPSEEEVRFQPIGRTGNEEGWPFSVDRGYLTCVWSAGERVVVFFEAHGETEQTVEPRGVLLSIDPLQLTVGNIANRDLFVPAADVAERIRQVAPFRALGERLCDQPPGAQLDHGEL
ncbi:MAG: hypothetical protein JNL61_06500 [Rhizobiaceae bacterium]|nr:hypothetical protein [Rhizobiaceae bacterium]